MNKYLKEYIIPAIFCGVGIGIVILIGIYVIQDVSYESGFFDGFCVDKNESYNKTELNITFYDNDIINCSGGIYSLYNLEELT